MELLTLYIVDDEPIILKGLVETYDWNSMGFQVVGFARDGEEALEEILRITPDLVLTDVRMKRMDGITLIENVKEKNDKINFIVISAYKDFEYAKKACNNGAISYLVKPLDEDKLKIKMSEVYEKCTEKKFKDSNYALWEKIFLEEQDSFLAQMFNKYLDDAVEEKELEEFLGSMMKKELLTHYYAVAVAGIDFVQRIINQKEYNMKLYMLEVQIYKKLKEKYQVWLKRGNDGILVFVVDLGDSEYLGSIKSILTDYQMHMNDEMISSLSKAEKGITGIKVAYKQANELYDIAVEAGAGTFTIADNNSLKVKQNYSLDIEMYILNAIRRNDLVQLKKSFEKFIQILPADDNGVLIYVRRLAARVECLIDEFMDFPDELRERFQVFYKGMYQMSVHQIVYAFYQLLVSVVEWKQSPDSLGSRQYFQEYISIALAYIQTHLNEELSISKIAEQVHLNQVYFGRLFKNVMKMSFNRYLQNLRIEEAKKMLVEDKSTITEICDKVGIANPSYFSQLFKKNTGMMPSEYKRRSKDGEM